MEDNGRFRYPPSFNKITSDENRKNFAYVCNRDCLRLRLQGT